MTRSCLIVPQSTAILTCSFVRLFVCFSTATNGNFSIRCDRRHISPRHVLMSEHHPVWFTSLICNDVRQLVSDVFRNGLPINETNRTVSASSNSNRVNQCIDSHAGYPFCSCEIELTATNRAPREKDSEHHFLDLWAVVGVVCRELRTVVRADRLVPIDAVQIYGNVTELSTGHGESERKFNLRSNTNE